MTKLKHLLSTNQSRPKHRRKMMKAKVTRATQEVGEIKETEEGVKREVVVNKIEMLIKKY